MEVLTKVEKKSCSYTEWGFFFFGLNLFFEYLFFSIEKD
nr:MAG TPA: hypothetical protein [Caudoviricetes sp.]